MKALLIDPDTRGITVQEYDGQPHSLYTLFSSLLLDQHDVLHEHNVYGGADAFEQGMRPFFLGEKLLFGKAVITGRAGFEECDVSIAEAELERLVQFELPAFYRKTLTLLPKDFIFDETYTLLIEETPQSITPEWVFYAFNMADDATKAYFLTHMEKAIAGSEDIHTYLKKMGEIAVKSMR